MSAEQSFRSKVGAVIVEERDDCAGATWWTLVVDGGAAMTASYPSLEAAARDAPLWCGATAVPVRRVRTVSP